MKQKITLYDEKDKKLGEFKTWKAAGRTKFKWKKAVGVIRK